jgi:ATP-dependent protease ClpP protease subunit
MHEFREIEIAGHVSAERELPYAGRMSIVDRCTSPADVIREIDAAEAAGVRRILLSIDSMGGEYSAALAMFGRLRRFSNGGGEVVAFVARASSIAPGVVLAADYIVLGSDARFAVHSAWNPGGELAIRDANREMARWFSRRTLMPESELLEIMSEGPHHVTWFLGLAAIQTGFADEVGTLERAREIASGGPLPETIRRVELAARARERDVEVSERSDNLKDASTTAIVLSTQPSQGVEGFTWPNTSTIYPVSPSDALVKRHEMAARNWTAQNGVPAGRFMGVAWSPTLSRFCAIGYNGPDGFAVTTSDGTNYAAQTIPAGVYKGICWDPAGGKYIAVGYGICATSSTGLTGSWATNRS